MALPQALVRESVAGARLQITLKCLGLHPVGKGNVTNETPWSEFRRVGRFAGIVILEAAFEISGYADIAPARRGNTFNKIDILHDGCPASLAMTGQILRSAGRAKQDGGWGGIRTHETLAGFPVFKTGALNRSATHPLLF